MYKSDVIVFDIVETIENILNGIFKKNVCPPVTICLSSTNLIRKKNEKRICKQNVYIIKKQIKFHRSDQWIIISDEIRKIKWIVAIRLVMSLFVKWPSKRVIRVCFIVFEWVKMMSQCWYYQLDNNEWDSLFF